MKPPHDVFASAGNPASRRVLIVVVGLLAVASLLYYRASLSGSTSSELATATAERRTFKRALRRQGFIQPLKEERIYAKLAGTISELAIEGSLAEKGSVVLKLDPQPFEDLKVQQEDLLARQSAEYKKLKDEALKTLNLAREDVKSYALRLELEELRLAEIKKGPTPTDEVNAQVNLDNNKILLEAKEDEEAAIDSLAQLNFVSKEELRQKQLETVEQRLKVIEMDIAHRKLNIIDPVKIGEQELKVREAAKALNAAKSKVFLLEKTLTTNEDRFKLRQERTEDRLKELIDNIAKTVYCAPCSGVVIPRKSSWSYKFAPGRECYDGQEILTIPDMSQMKVKLTIDEGRVGSLALGMHAEIIPAGWSGKPFSGKVSKISDQGRDEFEQFNEDTTAISGTANRKVFEVEIEIEGHSPILRLGLRSDVEIVLGEQPNAIVIPRAAIIRHKDGSALAQVLDSKDTVLERKIKVLSESDLWASVDGIHEGERVLLSEAKLE